MGKGDRRLHDRTQSPHEVMQLRWRIAFDMSLSKEEKQKLIKKLEELTN